VGLNNLAWMVHQGWRASLQSLKERKIRLLKPDLPFRRAMPAKVAFTLPLLGLSPICGKPVVVLLTEEQ
jgi:hypothetical protein